MDYDDLFGNDLIGTTILDLEDRYFSHFWQSVPSKPIETRPLSHPSSSVPQGFVRCWVDILPESARASSPEVFIEKEPAQELEIRLIVYGARGVPLMDIEGTSDVFFKCYFAGQKKKSYTTDCHYRNMDGCPNFNYRVKIPFKNEPKTDKRLYITCWDRDLIGSNDSIGVSVVDLTAVIKDVCLTQRAFDVGKRYWNSYLSEVDEWKNLDPEWEDRDSFWIPIYEKEGFAKTNGDVRIGISIVTKEAAARDPLGKGRSEPNASPYLPAPEGRVELSLNPLKMLRQIVHPKYLRALRNYVCCIICCVICAYLAPSIISNMVANFFA